MKQLSQKEIAARERLHDLLAAMDRKPRRLILGMLPGHFWVLLAVTLIALFAPLVIPAIRHIIHR